MIGRKPVNLVVGWSGQFFLFLDHQTPRWSYSLVKYNCQFICIVCSFLRVVSMVGRSSGLDMTHVVARLMSFTAVAVVVMCERPMLACSSARNVSRWLQDASIGGSSRVISATRSMPKLSANERRVRLSTVWLRFLRKYLNTSDLWSAGWPARTSGASHVFSSGASLEKLSLSRRKLALKETRQTRQTNGKGSEIGKTHGEQSSKRQRYSSAVRSGFTKTFPLLTSPWTTPLPCA